MRIREATPQDWAAIWPFMQRIPAAGDTFSLPVDWAEEEARRLWHPARPGRTCVAEGEAKALVMVLDSRGIQLTTEQRERITSCTDLDEIESWPNRAATVASADELFG